MKNRIKQVRKERKETLQQVADAVGLSNGTIANYENGEREPNLEIWSKLANHFGVAVGYLQGVDKNLAKPHYDEFHKFMESSGEDIPSAFKLWQLQEIDNALNLGYNPYKFLNNDQICDAVRTVESSYNMWSILLDPDEIENIPDSFDAKQLAANFARLIELIHLTTMSNLTGHKLSDLSLSELDDMIEKFNVALSSHMEHASVRTELRENSTKKDANQSDDV